MSFRTLMQAGPTKATELFVKLSETSDGAVKTRDKLFAELKAELELHTSLEEQHLFPILRRNAETKELVAEAIKDNKDLRAKLAELETLPKNDEAFPERLKDLQKTFRQHARDEKRELLPAVQRALSEEQVQGIAEKIEAGVAEAEQVRQDEVEARRAKAQQEREQAERQAEQQAAAQQAQEEAKHRADEAAEAVARTATAAQTGALHIARTAATGAQRIGADIREATDSYIHAVQAMAPDPRALASLPEVAVGAMTDIRSAWLDWMSQTTRAGTQISQDLLRQAAEQQRRLATGAMQGWLEHNTRVMQITLRVAQEGFRPFAHRPAAGSDDQRSGR